MKSIKYFNKIYIFLTCIIYFVLKGFRNDFQEAMEQVDQAYLNEILASSKPQDRDGKGDVHVPDEGVTYEDLQKMSIKLNKGDRDFDLNVITQFIQFLVQMWGNQLNSRSTAEKMSTRGKMASATYAQTREYLKPLLRKLKNRSLPEDITDSLTDIVKHLLERNYILVIMSAINKLNNFSITHLLQIIYYRQVMHTYKWQLEILHGLLE